MPALLPSYLDELATVDARRVELDALIKAATSSGDEDDAGEDDANTLSPAEFAKLKKDLAGVKKQHKEFQREFITRLGKTRAELTAVDEQKLVLQLTKNNLTNHLDGYVTTHRQHIIDVVESWWNKYAIPLHQIEHERDAAAAKLAAFLMELGYQ